MGLVVCLIGVVFFSSGVEAEAANVPVYRVYNANNSDHLYTTDYHEKSYLISIGWQDEGIGWYALDYSSGTGAGINCMYNPNSGEHLYTCSFYEIAGLRNLGWIDQGRKFYGAPVMTTQERVPVHRLFNPNAGNKASHVYTTNQDEAIYLKNNGWIDDGIVFWVAAKG